MKMTLRFFLLIGIILYFFAIIYFLKKKSLALKYTLLWIFFGITMFFAVLFPSFIDIISKILSIASPVNAVFALALFFLMIILVSITSIVSKQNEKSKKLIQEIAILEKRVRELENDTIING